MYKIRNFQIISSLWNVLARLLDSFTKTATIW